MGKRKNQYWYEGYFTAGNGNRDYVIQLVKILIAIWIYIVEYCRAHKKLTSKQGGMKN